MVKFVYVLPKILVQGKQIYITTSSRHKTKNVVVGTEPLLGVIPLPPHCHTCLRAGQFRSPVTAATPATAQAPPPRSPLPQLPLSLCRRPVPPNPSHPTMLHIVVSAPLPAPSTASPCPHLSTTGFRRHCCRPRRAALRCGLCFPAFRRWIIMFHVVVKL